MDVLISDYVADVEERCEGTTETDELGGEDVQVSDGFHLGEQISTCSDIVIARHGAKVCTAGSTRTEASRLRISASNVWVI